MSKNLIVYFSSPGENYFSGKTRNDEEGNTKKGARIMKDLLDADWFELEMETPYSQIISKQQKKRKLSEKRHPA